MLTERVDRAKDCREKGSQLAQAGDSAPAILNDPMQHDAPYIRGVREQAGRTGLRADRRCRYALHFGDSRVPRLAGLGAKVHSARGDCPQRVEALHQS